ncbi:DUF3082 domain-containing protein [Prochlorococcus marinus]|uniref:DUF3082 domain-containing protein n=1 Tax=Prochlorococcus marinus (strain MIT 9211) TaxID=93059 RepID=A9B9Y2_PROM4|nr:Hypothetical protein P9211_07131 [Prochlorococcus marinus str. MIT 9211]
MSNTKDKPLPVNHSGSPTEQNNSLGNDESGKSEPVRKGPLSFLSGALTSLLFAWVALLLSEKLVVYFTIHSPNYSSPIAQSIRSGFKTLVIGMSFLATFTFAFIGLGLTIVFIRSLFDASRVEGD